MNGDSLWDSSIIAILVIICVMYVGRHLLRLFGKGEGACGSSCCSGSSSSCDTEPTAKKEGGAS